MRNIIAGIVFMVAGASGQFVLRGTGSPGLLILVGLVVVVVGVVQVASANAGATTGADTHARLANDEQWQQYQNEKVEREHADHARRQEVDAIKREVPGARATIDDLMQKAGAHLDDQARLALELETARRLRHEHATQPPRFASHRGVSSPA